MTDWLASRADAARHRSAGGGNPGGDEGEPRDRQHTPGTTCGVVAQAQAARLRHQVLLPALPATKCAPALLVGVAASRPAPWFAKRHSPQGSILRQLNPDSFEELMI